MGAPVFVMGDVHGEYTKLCRVLREAGLIDTNAHWTGADAHLWFLGDFFDRGPDGFSALDLAMRLQQEAGAAGGLAEALVGNHELVCLGARLFPGEATTGPAKEFRADWLMGGGRPADEERLTESHIRWVMTRPWMAHVQDCLLTHADALFYRKYGETVAAVNATLGRLIQEGGPAAWDQLMGDFNERDAFRGEGGEARAREFLAAYGGSRLVHGHTPIFRGAGLQPEQVTGPFIYAGGLCVNLDSCMYRGGPGFIWQMD